MDLKESVVFAVLKVLEAQSLETGEHLIRVKRYCQIFVEELRRSGVYADEIDAPFAAILPVASQLHDIGKIKISPAILEKPDALTDHEFEIMKRHTTLGGEILRSILDQCPGNEYVEMAIEIAEAHHEKWDGTGYPNGLAGTEIPLSARVVSIADVFDSLSHARCYKDKYSPAKCGEIMRRGKGVDFDPVLLDAFLELDIHRDA